MGASRTTQVLDVLIPEALPGLNSGFTITLIIRIGWSALAGTVGAGHQEVAPLPSRTLMMSRVFPRLSTSSATTASTGHPAGPCLHPILEAATVSITSETSLDLSPAPSVRPQSGLIGQVWEQLCAEAAAAERDPAIARTVSAAVLSQASFGHALAHRITQKLGNHDLGQDDLLPCFEQAYGDDPDILDAAASDLAAIRDRDPSNSEFLTPFLYFKGFLALQGQRVAHWLWARHRVHLARHIQSRISEVFGVDIHPAARIGKGVMLDHGSGLVIGETAVVEDDVSILQNVTLGGTGKETGDRHPKIRRGALIGAGATILGNIEIGVGAKIGAGSVVIAAVLPFTSVVGVPARPVGKPHTALPGITMNQALAEFDYVI